MKESSIDLRKELLKLRHDDKDAFLRLVAEMTHLVADPDFREIAALYSSWPVNIPACQVRPRRKKKAPTGYYVRNREQMCEYVLDDLLQVGSGLTRNLKPSETPNQNSAMTSLACEVADTMSGLRSHPDRSQQVWRICGHEKGSNEMARFKKWIKEIQKLPPPDAQTLHQWTELGFEWAQLKYGMTLDRCHYVQMYLNNAGQHKADHTKSERGKAGLLKRKFSQALRSILRTAD